MKHKGFGHTLIRLPNHPMMSAFVLLQLLADEFAVARPL